MVFISISSEGFQHIALAARQVARHITLARYCVSGCQCTGAQSIPVYREHSHCRVLDDDSGRFQQAVFIRLTTGRTTHVVIAGVFLAILSPINFHIMLFSMYFHPFLQSTYQR